ncbi:MAG: PQQ-like beta-propeller repeat protein [Planctomycetes bacterium]|nr:PQQ-like beta-propeller repeat protein [Planctomycetota bacterium]
MTIRMALSNSVHYKCRTPLGGYLLLSLVLLHVVFAGLLCASGTDDSALPDAFRLEDLLWQIEPGTGQYTIPRADRGLLFIGVNDMKLTHPVSRPTGGGILMCLEQSTGEMVWQLPIPRYMEGKKAPFHFNHWRCGVCSTPAIDGSRLYIVGPRGDILCLDRNGQKDGNDGSFKNEVEYIGARAGSDYRLTETDGDIIWRFDLIKDLSVVPHDVCGSSPLVYGDYLYVCTSNGVDNTHTKAANPTAPSLIVLDKRSGRLAATDNELIGKRMYHGHWSSPVAAKVGNTAMILFGGGDGVLYAFQPTRTIANNDKTQSLKKIWQYDCNPPDYRRRNGQTILYSKWNNKSPDGPSEIIATPVVYRDRIYLAIGQSPLHGPGQGMLSCIDAATGQMIWQSRKVDRTLSNVAIDNGLLFAADFTGRLHCFDADSGEHYWQHSLEAGPWSCSPAIIDGKVYVSTERNILWVLKADRKKQILARCHLDSMAITPAFYDGVLYLPTQKRLFALKINSGE